MYWFIGVGIIIFLIIRVISLTDQVRMHERWIKKFNKDIKALASDLAELKAQGAGPEEGDKAEALSLEKAVSDLDVHGQAEGGVTRSEKTETAGKTELVPTNKKVKVKASVRGKKDSENRFSFDLTNLSIESIISKIGIGLVLVGLGFLFNYAYDRGLITEQFTVLIGYMLGLAMYGSGFYTLKKDRKILGHVLIGGSVSAFYITTYAGYLFYDLLGQPLAFAILSAITLWAFLSSVYLKAQSISIVAVLGGLLVPFMTKLDFIGLSGIGIYVGILALGAMIIYFFHRWRYLQITAVISVYLALFLMGAEYPMSASEGGIFFALLIYLVIVHALPDILNHYWERVGDLDKTHEVLVNLVAPLITVVYAVHFNLVGQTTRAYVFAGLALVYGGAFGAFMKKQLKGQMNIIVSATSGLYLAYASILYFDGAVRPAVLLTLGLAFYYTAGQLKAQEKGGVYLSYIGHTITVSGLFFAGLDLVMAFDTGGNVGAYIGHGLSVIIMVIGASLQSGMTKKVTGVIAVQIYASLLLLLVAYDNVLQDTLLKTLLIIYFLWLIVTKVVKDKLGIIPDLGLVIYAVSIPVIRGLMAFTEIMNSEYMGQALVIGLAVSIGIFALADIWFKDERDKSSLKAVALLTCIVTVVPDLYVLTDTLTYGVTIIGLVLLVYARYDKDKFPIAKMVKSTYAYLWFVLLFLSSGLVLAGQEFSILLLSSALIQLVILLYLLREYVKDETACFIGYSVLFFFTSYSVLAGLSGADGSITLTWAAYALLRLTYHMLKGQKKLTYYALGLIVFVVGKYILVDISTVSVLWKVITSMIFGFALLLLSYFIQPMIDKFSNKD